MSHQRSSYVICKSTNLTSLHEKEDGRLLTYTSAPLPQDMEITGYPILTLHVAANVPDAAFFARIPAQGGIEWQVGRGQPYASAIQLPVVG